MTRASLLIGCAGFLGATVALSVASGASGSTGDGSAEQADAGSRCGTLVRVRVPPDAFGLPASGATVTRAVVETDIRQSPFCKVTGTITAMDPADPPISFQLNLPTAWNGKAVQFGGGGLNGTVVSGLDPAPGAASDAPKPLAQGYATFGSDSGHSGSGFDARFAMNDQALANYSGESVKRTHDAATYLIERFYGRRPRRTYHVGGSKGGHEGLVAAQRYATDYDGVVAFFPASQNQAMVLDWFEMWKSAYGVKGGALNAAKLALVKRSVLAACDLLDGVPDGIVAATKVCERTFAVNDLRCSRGVDSGDACLSDPQIDTLQRAASDMRFPFPLANGVRSIGPFPVYLGADMGGTLFDSYGTTGATAAYALFANQVIPYFDVRRPGYAATDFELRDHQARIQKLSEQYDASDPDIDAFRNRRGKLIVVQGTADMLVPESMTTAYVDRLRERYGAGLRSFVRYYVQPGYGHGGGDFQLVWDSLSALDRWVESGKPPISPVATDGNKANKGRAMPLCEQPRYPRYSGRGDPRDARSYTCSLEDPRIN